MRGRPVVCTPADLQAVIDITRAIADAVGQLGAVPSGELYAHLNAAGMALGQYNAVIEALEGAGIVSVKNNIVIWTGESKVRRDA